MQVIANIDQADIGLVEQAKSVTFDVDAFPGEEFKGTLQQMRLNPQNVQNVVTYNVVIDVSNPEQKLKPGMTANLTVTIDERRDVLKVPNSALRFTPQTTDGQQSRNSNGSRRSAGQRQNAEGANNANGGDAAANRQTDGAAQPGGGRGQFARATEPVLPGQTRRVWVMGADGKPEPRRVKVGLSDGSATELVEGELREGDVIVTGQNVTASASSRTQSGGQPAPGFGGAPRVGGAGGRGGGGGGRR
jgi:HlyD family secretion protein